jgi:hypothetical protein
VTSLLAAGVRYGSILAFERTILADIADDDGSVALALARHAPG